MSKYLKTKEGSLESAVLEAMSPAQQAAIAISKKEKEQKENNYIHAAKMAKEKGEKTFTIGGKEYDVEEALATETNKNDKSDDGDGMDAVQPKAVKKKFADRKDKDIDNDGDVDDSDKFLHKRRKAVSKAINKEEVELDEDTVILDLEDDDKKLMANIKRMGIKVKKVSNEPGDGYAEYSLSGSKSNLEKANKKLKLVDDDIMSFKEEVELDEGYSAKEIKMAIGIASDKRYAGGNMSGAVSAIEKIKKGLSDHKQVAAVLKRQNESLAQQAARHITNMWQEAAKKAENAKPSKLMGTKEAMCEDCGKEPCGCKSESKEKSAMTGKPMAKVEVNPKESKAK